MRRIYVSDWAEKGIALYHQLDDENQISYFHHFSFYQSLHSEHGLSVEIAEAAIQHFKEIQDFRFIHKYCIALAEWYYNNRKYKLASIFYREGIRYGYIYSKKEKWEDIVMKKIVSILLLVIVLGMTVQNSTVSASNSDQVPKILKTFSYTIQK